MTPASQKAPPRVEYKLTALGDGLVGPLGALCEWAEKYFATVQPEPQREQHEQKRLSA
jgi:DNA-binding HxlR family transcriptional regulator